MKKLAFSTLVLLALVLVAGQGAAQSFGAFGFGERDTRTLLVLKADGSCALTNEAVEPRRTLEMQVNSWARYAEMEDNLGTDQDEGPSAPPTTKPSQKKLTDEELSSKVRQMYERRSEFGQDEEMNVAKVEVSTNSVRIVTGRSFASLAELLSQSPYSWGPNVLMFEDARFEIDTNHNLRINFIPSKEATRYAKNLARGWKSSKMKFEWRLVLPGKILSSGFPGVQDNATWLSIDADKPETVDAALKLVGAPLVVTAESGGIKLDEPLDSKSLARNAGRQHKSEPDVPITDAGPGFSADPVSITISTVHVFPEGEKYFKARSEFPMPGMDSPGMVVSLKLIPPRGREIRSVSGLKVKAAKDDKGRTLKAPAEAEEEQENDSEMISYNVDESEKSGATRVELRMGLPAPDARSIDEVQAEAIALTVGGWKEMLLTNVQADAQKRIDLSEVLQGATLILKKISGRQSQKTIQAILEGPKAVSQLEVKVKLDNPRAGQSHMTERRSTTSGDKTTRNITIQAYQFQGIGEAKSGPLTLVVRYPQEMRRERIQFKLTALDLL